MEIATVIEMNTTSTANIITSITTLFATFTKNRHVNYYSCILVFSAVLFCVLAFLPVNWREVPEVSAPDKWIDTLYIIHPNIHSVLFWGSAFITIAMLVFASNTFRRKFHVPYRKSFLCLALLGFPVASISFLSSNTVSWFYHGYETDNRGARYYFMGTRVPEDQQIALARLRSQNLLYNAFEVLVMSDRSRASSHMSIVRPSGVRNRFRRIFLTGAGVLLGLREQNKVYLAYDLVNKNSLGADAIASLSPFIIIERDTLMNQKDIQRLLQSGVGNSAGQPRREVVQQALQHANRNVQQVAATLLRQADVTVDP